MRYRRLGSSGLKVSHVSLGSWLTYGGAVDADTATECVRTALDQGIISFDTADIYDRGGAERVLGESFERLGVRRRDVVIATKAFWPMSANPNDRGLSRKHLTESLAGSLERLRTDYVDLYQCHRFDEDTPIEEVVRTMDGFIRQGRVLYWGVSVWSAEHIREACEIADRLGAPRPISNQPPYSLLERSIENDVLPTCEDLGLGQIVFSPLAQGILTGKYGAGNVPKGTRAADPERGTFMRPLLHARNLERVEKMRAIAADVGLDLPSLALAFTLARRSVASAIVGATRPEQIVQNAKAGDVDLDTDTLKALDELFPPGESAPRLTEDEILRH